MPSQPIKMTYAEFCTGIGGFRLGINQTSPYFECVYKNEIDSKCEKTYQENFNDNFDSRDIFNVQNFALPDFDMLCAGFPCQPFSIAGARQGFSDDRGQIIFKILDIIAAKKPKIIFLENVPNLKSHNKGRTLSAIIAHLAKLGYSVYYDILDSANFGLAQSRPRLYIVAFCNKNFGKIHFAFPKSNGKTKTIREILIAGENSIPISKKWEEYIDYYTNKKSIAELSFVPPKTRVNLERVSANCELADCIFQIRSSGIRAYSLDGQFPTFAVSNSGGGAMIPVLAKERRHISLPEIKRLMGFPETFQFSVSRTDSIKQLANAVCPPVIAAIMQEILSA
ncbi:MAG: DNA (cytosine-5-)-methyltransferase [Defluviitaleaceae bacterium]|nr:DNA (cytosine-5-)-methyltransferase [Defluviitaleaceae bacterium]